MQLIDKYQETRRKMDMAIDRGKLWVFCSRKRSYIIFNLLMYILLCWHFLPFFLKYGWLGLQPFKLFGLALGCGAGEVGYFSYRYYKLGNPSGWTEKDYMKRMTYMWLVMMIFCISLIIIQVVFWNCWYVDLVWLTGVGPAIRH